MKPNMFALLAAMSPTKNNDKPYRSGVAALFRNANHEVLLCKRKGSKEWQIPQGGCEGNESAEETLMREMMEELGTSSFRILEKARHPISYDFPADMSGKYAEKYRGQQHIWFLLQFDDGFGPNLDHAVDKEFDDCRWVLPSRTSVLDNIISWKRDSYIKGFSEFGFSLD